MITFSATQNRPIPSGYAKYVGSEDNLQKSVARYLNSNNAFWFHCPNGGLRSGRAGANFLAMGVISGVPDCLILDQLQGFAGMAIELKVGYNKVSPAQLEFLRKLTERNWLTWVSYSLDECIDLINWYYGIQTNAYRKKNE